MYEKLFLSVEKSIYFHLTAPPKVTFPMYKTQAISRASDNVKRSLRKNVSRRVEQWGSRVETEMWLIQNKLSSFIYSSLLPVNDILLEQCGFFLLICLCIRRHLATETFISCHLPSCQENPQVERSVCKHLFTETTGKPAPESSPPTALCFNSSYC